MKSINLYTITREISDSILPDYVEALTGQEDIDRIKKDEIDTIKLLVDVLLKNKVPLSSLCDWFYSFTIPRISKEFDLLKIGDNNVIINVELKSREIDEGRIKKQLVQNRHYLRHISTDIYSYTFVRCGVDDYKIYKYASDEFTETNVVDLAHAMSMCDHGLRAGIDKLFRPGDYLISPFHTPDKFVGGLYYLNTLQDNFKREIIKSGFDKKVWGISGGAGTGKTLLLYDIAREYAKSHKVGIIHCGYLNEGHNSISKSIDNLEIHSIHEDVSDFIRSVDVLLVDESQRLKVELFESLMNDIQNSRLHKIIFAYDSGQILSWSETKNDIPGRLALIDNFTECRLKDVVRIKPEINSFIRNMLDLSDMPKHKVNYDSVDVIIANSMEEFEIVRASYERDGYKYIAYETDECDEYDTYKVIGQEFDKVLVIIDDNFRYDDDGELISKEHQSNDYRFDKMFYQNISRAREKLCIVVANNPDIFEKLLLIKQHNI